MDLAAYEVRIFDVFDDFDHGNEVGTRLDIRKIAGIEIEFRVLREFLHFLIAQIPVTSGQVRISELMEFVQQGAVPATDVKNGGVLGEIERPEQSKDFVVQAFCGICEELGHVFDGYGLRIPSEFPVKRAVEKK